MTTIRNAATLEEHIEMGQAIKDAVNAMRNVLDTGERLGMLKAKDADRLLCAITRNPAIEKLRCRLDDELFIDCPWLTNDAFSVYYHDDERADAETLRTLARKEGQTD